LVVNGTPDLVKLKQGEDLTILVALNPNKSVGNLADYWIKAITPAGTIYWFNDQFQFVASETPIRVFGGP
jgi:hypothetical protein